MAENVMGIKSRLKTSVSFIQMYEDSEVMKRESESKRKTEMGDRE